MTWFNNYLVINKIGLLFLLTNKTLPRLRKKIQTLILSLKLFINSLLDDDQKLQTVQEKKTNKKYARVYYLSFSVKISLVASIL